MTVAAKGSEYIQQTVAVVPGKTYDFSVDLKNRYSTFGVSTDFLLF